MPFAELKFRHPWRPYQQRVLDAVDRHLSDSKLHVVAAPGSGKTILGLEIFKRLGKPALALAPTRTIRDQWVMRLKDFLPEAGPWPPVWTSTEVSKPATFTSITYQALHLRYREEAGAGAERTGESGDPTETADPGNAPDPSELEALAAMLASAGIGTLILDEAHHLRAEWWKALTELAERLPSLTIVSLTATPPYDVVGAEWNRYEELCGPIDEEISVPELVRAGTLCPHQDFVWTVVPLNSERELVAQYDKAVTQTCNELLEDQAFEEAVLDHPWVANVEPDEQAVLDQPEAAIALLVFLKAKGKPLPMALPKLLDVERDDLPPLDRRWWQSLVANYLARNQWPLGEAQEEHRRKLAERLRARHLLSRKELRLDESRLVKSHLTLSAAKIGACIEIHRAERRLRGAALRQVVLTDFIRDETFDAPTAEERAPLGAWPLFRALVSDLGGEAAADVALLTGRLVVMHGNALPHLRAAMPGEKISTAPIGSLPGFHRVSASGTNAVSGVTSLLTQGAVRTIVGTRSLLGEGWDAPAVNSLVLASFVGSFMLTNQMRGRAVRIDRASPQKVSSVWHIVAVAPELPSGLADVRELGLRFRTFVGLSERDLSIESGIERLTLPYLGLGGVFTDLHSKLSSSNRYMLERLERIETVASRWKEAVEKGEAAHLAPTVKVAKPPSAAPVWFRKTLKLLLLQIIAGFFMAFFGTLAYAPPRRAEGLVWLLLIAAGVATLYVLPRLAKAAWILLRHLPVDGTIEQIALAVRDSLCQTDHILGAPSRFTVITSRYHDGSVGVCLSNGTFFERSLFADCVNEILGPIRNPRYLLTRSGTGWKSGRRDFHAVPQVLGARKGHAEVLKEAWLRRVGPAELIYVRGSEGRRELLKARARAFSTAMQPTPERLDQWH